MARQTKQQVEQAQLLSIRGCALQGVERVNDGLRNARRLLAQLKRPVGNFGRTHAHTTELVDSCGWCANIRSWGRTAALHEAALPCAVALEEEIRELARDHTQRQLRDTYPRVRWELIVQLWREAR